MSATPADRFWPKVQKTDTCWLWTASLDRGGYGNFRITETPGHKTQVKAHRWAYEQANGPIPSGLYLDHLCRVRNCVNPDHLEAVTHKTNVLRGISPVAQNADKTHCKRGHLFDDSNIIWEKNRRRCRTCTNTRNRIARRAVHTAQATGSERATPVISRTEWRVYVEPWPGETWNPTTLPAADEAHARALADGKKHARIMRVTTWETVEVIA